MARIPLGAWILIPLLCASAGAAVPKASPVVKLLKLDLSNRASASFADILKHWEMTYGPEAVDPLLSIASDRKNSDPDRYVALMGAAKLGGQSQAPRLVTFLKDPSWMVRSGGLRALSALGNDQSSGLILPLLQDKALVVRLEAVNAIEKLRPKGSVQALVEALYDNSNYHAGKAQWVPQRALAALVALKAREAAPRLAKLLDRSKDEEMQRQTVAALETLRGKTLKSDRPLSEKIQAWRTELR